MRCARLFLLGTAILRRLTRVNPVTPGAQAQFVKEKDMAGYKNGRITSDIHREMSALIRTCKDPRISPLVNIVKVDVSGDLSYAKIYVSTIDGEQATIDTVKGLKSAAGYLRRELSSRLGLRKTPELKFIADDSIAQSAHIAGIIEAINHDEVKSDDE